MTEIKLLAKSSSGDSYGVWFTWADDQLSVFCNCKAGEYGKFCKHKWQLMSGDESMLYDINEKEQLIQVVKWVAQTDFEHLYDKVEALQNQIAVLRQEIKAEKKIVEMRMRNGF